MDQHPNAQSSARGFSLIESMSAMAILAVALLGVANVHVAASAQNGIGRRASTAAAIARDFSEVMARWEFDDDRLEADCGADLAVNFPVTDEGVRNERYPAVQLDFAATATGAVGGKADVGNALTLNGASYEGTVEPMLQDHPEYQLLWSVRAVNPDDTTATTGCRMKVINVVVRYRFTGEQYNNVITSVIKYDPSQITRGGLPEPI